MVRTGLLAHAPLRRGSHRRERTCLRRMWDCVLQSRVLAREGRHSRAAIGGAVDHLSRYGKLSPGTAKTMFEGLPEGGRIRQDGRIVKVPSTYKVETIPFTESLSATAVTIPWGDVATAYYSTGIPNIEVFVGVPEKQIGKMKMPGFMRWLAGLAPVQAFMKAQIARRVKGPTDEQRARDEVYLYGEAWDDAGHKVAMRLRTREGYTLTAESGVKATLKVIEGRLAPGAHTPSMAFGADYVLELEGTTLSRVAS